MRNYPPMQFLSATWRPVQFLSPWANYYLTEPTILTTPGKKNIRVSTSLIIWKLEMEAVIWQKLPFQQHLRMRILDKKLPQPCNFAKIWYLRECTSLTIWWLCQFIATTGNQKSRLIFYRTYHFNNTWEGEYWIKNYPDHVIWAKIWYVRGCSFLKIWWLCQFIVLQLEIKKSKLIYDRTYHFNNTWEGEYSIKNYPAMQLLAKIWYVRGCTSLIIWQLYQYRLAPPENERSRLLFDRTYLFNNSWEGEYLIRIYPAMQFWHKFGMLEGVHLW